jgi:group I intron endonuclease
MKYTKYESGVYGIYSFNNHCIYIGATKDFDARFRQHLKMLIDKNHHNKKLNEIVEKIGVENLIFKEILRCNDSEIFYYETLFIKIFLPLCNGNNEKIALEDKFGIDEFYKLKKHFSGLKVTMEDIRLKKEFNHLTKKAIGMIMRKNNVIITKDITTRRPIYNL